MPTAYIKSLHKKTGKSIQSLEKEWDKAKKAAAKQGKGDNFAYITGIFKKLCGEASVATTYQDLLIRKEQAVRIETSAKKSVLKNIRKGDKFRIGEQIGDPNAKFYTAVTDSMPARQAPYVIVRCDGGKTVNQPGSAAVEIAMLMNPKQVVARLSVTAAAEAEKYAVLKKAQADVIKKVKGLGKEIRDFNKRIDKATTQLEKDSHEWEHSPTMYEGILGEIEGLDSLKVRLKD